MTQSNVKYALEGDVAVITLADPATLNSVTAEMMDDMGAAFDRAGREARCAVLTGEGRGFCSGAKLSGAFPKNQAGETDLGLMLEQHANPLVLKMRNLPIPFITAVNGAAAGIGCSFALLGDLIVAGESAYFLQAFRRIGLAPDGGSTWLLPRMVTRAQAMELMLLGEKLPAPKALEWGLINRCVPDAEMMPTAMALAQTLADGATGALAATRKLAWDALHTDFATQLRAEREAQFVAGKSKEFAEGVAAFNAKRPTNFKNA